MRRLFTRPTTIGRPRRARLAILGVATVVLGLPSGPALAAPALVRLASAAPSAPTAAAAADPAAAAAASQGLTPADLHAAYALPLRGAPRQMIAVVSPYDDPYVQADLNAYSTRFGLPSCTAHNRCLGKLNQDGASSPLPPQDPTGGIFITESALGIEIAHGVCESCSLLLVEPTTASETDIAKSVAAAARAGATVVVTAYTAPDQPNKNATEFSSPHAAVVAAAGDSGYTGSANYPAALPNVLAVGGTQLRFGPGNRPRGEVAWGSTTSGCSLYQSVPSWQAGIVGVTGCGTQRAVADVAAAADPGAIVRITGAGQAGGPWYVAGGTSLSAPIIAGVIGLAGSVGDREAQMLYQRERSDPSAFHDIRGGTDATGCTVTICQAGRGWDGPTGLGTPYGLAAFLPSGGALSAHSPQISISAAHGGLHVNGNRAARLTVHNDNAFAIEGTIAIRRTVSIGGQLRPVVFGSAKLSIGPLGWRTQSVVIAQQYLGLLKSLGSGPVYVQLRVRGRTGPSVTPTKSFRLYAP